MKNKLFFIYIFCFIFIHLFILLVVYVHTNTIRLPGHNKIKKKKIKTAITLTEETENRKDNSRERPLKYQDVKISPINGTSKKNLLRSGRSTNEADKQREGLVLLSAKRHLIASQIFDMDNTVSYFMSIL